MRARGSPKPAVKLVDFFVANREAGQDPRRRARRSGLGAVRKAVEPTLDELGNAMVDLCRLRQRQGLGPCRRRRRRAQARSRRCCGGSTSRSASAGCRSRTARSSSSRRRTPSSRAADHGDRRHVRHGAARGSGIRLGAADATGPGYLFLLPWLIGFFGLTLGPALASLYLSFTDFDLLQRAALDRRSTNYQYASPPTIRTSGARCRSRFIYVAWSVPLKLAFALALAMLLNRGIARPAALPRAVLSAVAARRERRDRRAVAADLRAATAWSTSCSAQFGIEGPSWISNPDYCALHAGRCSASGSSARR